MYNVVPSAFIPSNPRTSCGAKPGESPAHLAAARSLAQAFHANNISLVYGGGTVGVMGELAKTLVSLSGPSSVHGIIPEALLKYERKGRENGDADTPDKIIDENVYGRTTGGLCSKSAQEKTECKS